MINQLQKLYQEREAYKDNMIKNIETCVYLGKDGTRRLEEDTRRLFDYDAQIKRLEERVQEAVRTR